MPANSGKKTGYKKTDKSRNAKQSSFDAVVFAGGGTRCLWQVGFLEIAAPELNIKPTVVAGVSAGAAMACMVYAGKATECLEYFKEITGNNEKNFYPRNLFTGKPSFPHYDMYRDTVLRFMDEQALKKLKNDHDIKILLARPPKWLGPRSATFVGFMTYSIEKKIVFPVHSSWSMKLGFIPEVVSVSECKTPDDLADLILQSSCTPPFVPIMFRNGGTVLDGGLVDNVPIMALRDFQGEALLMLTRQYAPEKIINIPGRTYVQPSEPIPITKWDYTSPEGLQTTYDLGRRDGEVFIKEWRR
ncbi:MAG: patatin-like phospholipase family protein [Spirochaetes bacterium]|nr:patatin-like phospholipase family protein [Spirochaetota bacterium]